MTTDTKAAKAFDRAVDHFKAILAGDDALRVRAIANAKSGVRFCLFYFDGMVNTELLSLNLVGPLENGDITPGEGVLDRVGASAVWISKVETSTDDEKIVTSIQYGDCLVVVEGANEYLLADVKGFIFRSTDEPDLDKTLTGPKEGYNEILMFNLSQLRRRLLTNDLRVKMLEIGTRTKTKVAVAYLDSLADKRIVDEVNKRLTRIDIDGVLDTNYVNEFIRDAPHSIFNTTGMAERPDITAAKLLEGRVAVFVDGSPEVLTVPFLFAENFQANEDYYINYLFGSMNRVLRVLAFVITTCAPALYLAVVTFHQEIIPTPMLLSASAARQEVPFPTIVELILMLIVFEILRETGIRMSTSIGQAFSIVGALVLGQAAVEAKIISAPVIIIVALSGITGLMLPRMSFLTAVIRMGLIVCSFALGLYGFTLGALALLTHMCRLTSFFAPYMLDMTFALTEDANDTLLRGPWWDMYLRPRFMAADRRRMKGRRRR